MKMNFKFKNKYDYQLLNKFLKKHRMKASEKRNFIIDYFLTQDKHLSIEELYDCIKQRVNKISFSTVYRTLKLLSACGLASLRHFEKGVTRFEPVHRKEHHDHLICLECGTIIEFENREIEKIQRRIAQRYKFYVKDHKLEIYGLCLKCAKGRRYNGAL